MKEKLAMLEPLIHRLTKHAAALDLSVSVVIKPVLCPLDDNTAMMDSWVGSMLGTVAGRSQAYAPAEEAKKAYEARQAHDCRCMNGECACRKEDFFANGASDDPATWLDKRDSQ